MRKKKSHFIIVPWYIFKRKTHRSPIPNFKSAMIFVKKKYHCLERTTLTLIFCTKANIFANQLWSCSYLIIYIHDKSNSHWKGKWYFSFSQDQILNFQLPTIIILMCSIQNSTWTYLSPLQSSLGSSIIVLPVIQS